MAYVYEHSGAFDRLVDQLHAEVVRKEKANQPPRRAVLAKSQTQLLVPIGTFKRVQSTSSVAAPTSRPSQEQLIVDAVVSGRLSGCDGEIGLKTLAAGKQLDPGFLAAIGAEV